MMEQIAGSSMYRLTGLGGILAGQIMNHQSQGSAHEKPQTNSWTVASGVYTPRELVEGFAPLLETVVHRLGEDPPNTRPARAMLLGNLASNLATHTRESTLPLQTNFLDLSRREMKEQAERIGNSLVKWARETTNSPFNPDLKIRSTCENHLLTQPNVELMFGRRSQPHLMQLFNEYMHQMVLLRDALLPFSNYEDVLIPVDGKASRGIRHLEPSRAQFLTVIFTKGVTQASLMTYAKALLAPNLPQTTTGGYGFQYLHGTILPAFLRGGDTPFHLLTYAPTKLDPLKKTILFDYEFEDYYNAARLDISKGFLKQSDDLIQFPSQTHSPIVQSATLGLVPSEASSIRQLELQLELNNGRCANIDVGQIARGHRYSYQASTILTEKVLAQSIVVHNAIDVLLHPDSGLITLNKGGIHVIPTKEPIIALATLGKLYPENVVLLPENGHISQTEKAGKGFEPKFVIWGGIKNGGLKGRF